MSDERIEPSIDHEYLIDVGTEIDTETRDRMLVVRVKTVREFTSFAYDITLNLSVNAHTNHVHLEVGGLSIPSVSKGGAVSESRVKLMPAGTYEFTIAKKNRTLVTTLAVSDTGNVAAAPAANTFAAIQS